MTKVLKSRMLTWLAASLTVAVATLSTSVKADENRRYAGTEIVVAELTRGTSNAFKKFIPEFEKKTGIKVRFEQYPARDLLQRILLDVEAKTGRFDVMYLSPSWMGPLIKGNHLLPLDKMLAEQRVDLKDFMPIGLDLVRYPGRSETWALPSLLTSHVMVYRKDLFEDPKEKAAFKAKYGYELTPPTSMDQLLHVAEFFTRDTTGNGSIDMYGMAEPQKMHFQAWDWAQALIWSFGGDVLDSKMRPILLSPQSIAAFEFGKKLQAFQPRAVMGWEAENNAFFRSGKVAIMRVWNEGADALSDPARSPIADKVGYTLIPPVKGTNFQTGKSRIGGGGLAVLRTSRNQQAAFEYVKWATSSELANKLYAEGGSIVRISVFDDEKNRKLKPWLNELFPVVSASIKHTAKHRATTPESFAIEEQIAQAWVTFLRGDRTAEQALRTAHDNIDRIMRQAGYY